MLMQDSHIRNWERWKLVKVKLISFKSFINNVLYILNEIKQYVRCETGQWNIYMHVSVSISVVSYCGKVSDVHVTRWPMLMHSSKIFGGQPNASYFATSLKSWCPSLAKYKAMHLLQWLDSGRFCSIWKVRSLWYEMRPATSYTFSTYMENLNLQESIPVFKQTGISINIHYRILFVICL